MKKRLLIIGTVLLIIGAVLCLSALVYYGNQSFFDTKRTYDRAIIKLANDEVIEVEVKEWHDFEGEQLQIITPDGTKYLTSSIRCDLIRD